MSLVLHLEVVSRVESQTVLGLNSGRRIFRVDTGHYDMAEVVPQLASTDVKVALSSDVDLGPFLDGSPTVSQLHPFAGIADHRVREVGVDSQGRNPFGGHCLDNLA